VPKHMLSARQVQVAREGDSHDGEGLLLRVQGRTASWVLRCRVTSGKRRDLGLGAADRSSIEAAGASFHHDGRLFKNGLPSETAGARQTGPGSF
jgi:hypothetical protein